MEVKPLHTKVEKEIQLTNGSIILEQPTGFPRGESNLYYILHEGKIVWKAEKPAPQSLFSRLKLNDDGDTLSAYTNDGYACDLDLRTGKLLNQSKIQ